MGEKGASAQLRDADGAILLCFFRDQIYDRIFQTLKPIGRAACLKRLVVLHRLNAIGDLKSRNHRWLLIHEINRLLAVAVVPLSVLHWNPHLARFAVLAMIVFGV